MPTKEDFKEVNGQAALDWVKIQNEKTIAEFDKLAEFEDICQKCYEVISSKHEIPYPYFTDNDLFQNFWNDHKNPRGILRQVDRESFRTEHPNWEVLLDIDALARSEGRNWVYRDVIETIFDKKTYALVMLSDGGSDAVVAREFDMETKTFVEGGFYIPEAKSEIEWYTKDSLLVSSNHSNDSLTQSGYPRTIRLLQREQALQQAKLLFEVKQSHLSASLLKLETATHEYLFFLDELNFYHTKYYLVSPDDLTRYDHLPIPNDADLVDIFESTALIQLRSDWQVAKTCFKSNSLVGLNLEKFRDNPQLKAEDLDVKLWYKPKAKCTINSVTSNSDVVFISLLNNVGAELREIKMGKNGYRTRKVPLPADGDIDVVTLSLQHSEVILSYETLISPCTLYLYDSRKKTLTALKQAPKHFHEENYQTQQFEAVSKDGTLVPYYLVAKKNLKLDGLNPTLLYGYGGFEDSLTPAYVELDGICLLEKGFVYAQANIRGGGEFGAQWHELGAKENKQNSFDDFIAVAQDLIKRGVTSSQYLGIQGSSNGGLLVAACAIQRPDLFAAVLCEVPLLDMLIYHQLCEAGSSWLEEYGDPDDPEMHKVLATYSPVHNLDPKKKYPKMFIQTSTNDDRVHPYHARIMTYELQQLGKPVYYYEEVGGGHSRAGTDLKRIAKNYARSFMYLYKQLLEPSLKKRKTS